MLQHRFSAFAMVQIEPMEYDCMSLQDDDNLVGIDT